MVKIVNKRLLKPVNEVTFTDVKRHELSVIEDCFKELKKYAKPWSCMKEIETDGRFMHTIPSYLCKLFGFNNVTMHLILDDAPNAMVILNFVGKGRLPSDVPEKVFNLFYDPNTPLLYNSPYANKKFDARKDIVELEHGFKINRELCPLDVDIYIHSGIIGKMKPDEIVAVLLHEIGHQFSHFFLNISDASSTGQWQRADEHFADNFAKSYGYSKALSSFLTKFTRYDFSRIPTNTRREDINREEVSKTIIGSGHPLLQSRVEFMNKSLKFDIDHQKDLTPREKIKLRKAIASNNHRSQIGHVVSHPNQQKVVKLLDEIDRKITDDIKVEQLTDLKQMNDLMTSSEIRRVPTRDYSYTVKKPSGEVEQYVAVKPYFSTPIKDLHHYKPNSSNDYGQEITNRYVDPSDTPEVFTTDGRRLTQDPNSSTYGGKVIRDFRPPYYERVRPGDSRQQGIIRRPSVDPRLN